jgi:uncharacterized protein (DUF983 family)
MSDWTDDETISDTDCVDGKNLVWPEHDFQPGLTECTRCGAEAADAGAVRTDLVFKGLATFVIGGLLYLTYWTAANMWIKEFLLLVLFDIFTFLSWSRTFARGMIHVYDLRPEPADDDPAEL